MEVSNLGEVEKPNHEVYDPLPEKGGSGTPEQTPPHLRMVGITTGYGL